MTVLFSMWTIYNASFVVNRFNLSSSSVEHQYSIHILLIQARRVVHVSPLNTENLWNSCRLCFESFSKRIKSKMWQIVEFGTCFSIADHLYCFLCVRTTRLVSTSQSGSRRLALKLAYESLVTLHSVTCTRFRWKNSGFKQFLKNVWSEPSEIAVPTS